MNIYYTRMSIYYLFYFTTIGAFMPYFNLYLSDKGLTNSQLGIVLASIPFMGLIVQPIWGLINDSLNLRKLTVMISLIMCPLVVLLFPLVHSFVEFILLVPLFATFQTGVVPIVDSMTLNITGSRDYGKIRLFGSLGYAMMAAYAGIAYRSLGIERLIWLYVATSILALVGLTVYPNTSQASKNSSTEKLKRSTELNQNKGLKKGYEGVLKLLHNRRFVFLLLSTMLLSISQGINNNFFTLYYTDLHHPLGLLGIIYGLGALSELPFFFVAGKWIERIGAQYVLVIAGSVFLFRWILLSLGPPTWVLLSLQLLHGASFGMGFASGISLANNASDETNRFSAQTIYSSVNTGLAAIIASVIGGEVLQLFGPKALYLFAAVVCMTGVLGLTLLNIFQGNVQRSRNYDDTGLKSSKND